LKIKNKIPAMWNFIETANGIIFYLLYYKELHNNLKGNLEKYSSQYVFRFIRKDDLEALHEFFCSQDEEQLRYFRPHKFDLRTLQKLYYNHSYFMMGAFDKEKLMGYFVLRCFINKQCFTGRIIDRKYQGKGISKNMSLILLNSSWAANFRVFSTISKYNVKSLASFPSIAIPRIVRTLDHDYIYYEWLKNTEKMQPEKK
jgi:hypothetical protein